MKSLETLKKYFSLISALALIFFSFISDGILDPELKESNQFIIEFEKFGNFSVTIVLILFLFPLIKFKSKKYSKIWWYISLAGFVGAAFLYFKFYSLKSDIVFHSDQHDEFFIAGDRLREEVEIGKAEAIQKFPKRKYWSNEELLHEFGDKPSDIWVANGIAKNLKELFFFYIFTILMFQISIISAIQAGISCEDTEILE